MITDRSPSDEMTPPRSTGLKYLELWWCLRPGFGGGGGGFWDFFGGYLGIGIGGGGVAEEVVGMCSVEGKEEKRFLPPGREEDSETITMDYGTWFSNT